MEKTINQAITYLKASSSYGKSKLRRFYDGLPGFFGFIGFQAFNAFPDHNPWFLFLFCFFVTFSEFRHWKDELKYLWRLRTNRLGRSAARNHRNNQGVIKMKSSLNARYFGFFGFTGFLGFIPEPLLSLYVLHAVLLFRLPPTPKTKMARF